MGLKDDYLTISEVARRLEVSRQTIWRWVNDGKFTAEKVGRQVFIPKEDVKEYESRTHRQIWICKLIEGVKDYISEQYGYSPDDIIVGDDVDKDTWTFSVDRKDGTHEKVYVRVGDPERLSRKKGNPFLLSGLKVPIKGISRKQHIKSAKKKSPTTKKGGIN